MVKLLVHLKTGKVVTISYSYQQERDAADVCMRFSDWVALGQREDADSALIDYTNTAMSRFVIPFTSIELLAVER